MKLFSKRKQYFFAPGTLFFAFNFVLPTSLKLFIISFIPAPKFSICICDLNPAIKIRLHFNNSVKYYYVAFCLSLSGFHLSSD